MNGPCYLVLADGEIYSGTSFGAVPPDVEKLADLQTGIRHAGEVLFNTGMSGYHEILTDPSYTGQIVVMTYPHIGNYGVDDDWCEVGFYPENRPGPIQVSGFAVRSLYSGPVPADRKTLHDYMKENNIPGISGIDTRALTLRLRDKGSINGIIVGTDKGDLTADGIKKVLDYLKRVPAMEGLDLLPFVGADRVISGKNKGLNVALLDCGSKANIVRELEKRDCNLTVYPSSTKAEEILERKPDGILVSNGPGDPGVLKSLINELKKMIGKTAIFGICLGHQTLCLALGGKTRKMKFGHHGLNHPVRNEFDKKVIVTSQNHGFVVDEASLPKDADIWFRNANDGTLEGIMCRERKLMTTQFHPEASPGPVDSSWIFDEFIKLIKDNKE